MNKIVDGMLLKGSSPKIYLISYGKKCNITSMVEFNKLGITSRTIKIVNDDTLEKIPVGPILVAIPGIESNRSKSSWLVRTLFATS